MVTITCFIYCNVKKLLNRHTVLFHVNFSFFSKSSSKVITLKRVIITIIIIIIIIGIHSF